MIDNYSLLSALEARDSSRLIEMNQPTSSRLHFDFSIDEINDNTENRTENRTARKKEDFTDRTHSKKQSQFNIEASLPQLKKKSFHQPTHSRTSNTFDSFRNTKDTIISPQIIFYSKEQNEIVSLDQSATIQFKLKTISNITLLKYTANQLPLDCPNLYYFGIYGDITYHRIKSKRSSKEKESSKGKGKVKQGYRIDICFDSLNQHNKNILHYFTSKNNDILTILKDLLYLNNFILTFSGISKKLLIQFSSFIKTINLKSFFGYYLLTNKMQTVNNTIAIKDTPITYEEIEDSAKHYIQFILEEFLKPFELGKSSTGRESMDAKSNSKNITRDEIYQMFIEIVNYLSCDEQKMTQIIKDFNKVGAFSITNDLIDLNTSIISHFFVTLNNPFSLLTKTWLNYQEEYGDTDANTRSIFNTRKRVGLTQNFGIGSKSSHYFIQNELYSSIEIIESYFYLLLIKMNTYYINSFMYCCGVKTSDNVNYSKGPFAFCFDCEILFCIKCFIYHSKHYYFDFSCTIKRKMGNIQSTPSTFLNWNKIGKANEVHNYKANALSGNHVEDFILKNILKNYSGSADCYFDEIINNSNNNIQTFNEISAMTIINNNKAVKKIMFSVFTFLDVFLIEYIYKLIYPFKNSQEYLEYYFNMVISQDVDFIELLRLISEKNICDAYWNLIEYLTAVDETEKDNEMISIIDMAIDSYSPTIEDFYLLHLNKQNEEDKKHQKSYEVFKGNIGVEIENQNLKGDLSQPIDYYSKHFQSTKREYLKKVSVGKDEEKTTLENILPLLDMKLEVNCNNESKWYKSVNEKNNETKVRYIDGFGSLFEYMIYYIDNIITSMTEFGNPYTINLQTS